MIHKIVVTVDGPQGRTPLEVEIDALDVESAKAEALRHVRRLGYENAALGFPKRKRGS